MEEISVSSRITLIARLPVALRLPPCLALHCTFGSPTGLPNA